jgi:hypothetical protein
MKSNILHLPPVRVAASSASSARRKISSARFPFGQIAAPAPRCGQTAAGASTPARIHRARRLERSRAGGGSTL